MVITYTSHRVRLTGAAASLGASYTRYADDLAFSGGAEFARRAGRCQALMAAIAIEEGFRVNHHKTRIMRPSQAHHLCRARQSRPRAQAPKLARGLRGRTSHTSLTLAP